MNAHLMILEILVVVLGLGVLMQDLWLPAAQKRILGYVAAAGLALLLIWSFSLVGKSTQYAFGQMYVMDGLALYFKQLFLLAAIIVLIMSVEFADSIEAGISEFYALILFALAGMMFAASANNFALLFVALELITVTFYILTSFQRRNLLSLEAGVKYLIIGALSSAFMVYGIALIFGTTGALGFDEVAAAAKVNASSKILLLGILFVMAGLGFKIAAFPVQIWAPDVYQGSPTPTTAFLAIGSKAAGFVLLLRVLFVAVPDVTLHWSMLVVMPHWHWIKKLGVADFTVTWGGVLAIISMLTILYGNLCALKVRKVKRLLGYSSIANAGYVLMGVASLNSYGQAAVLYYLGGYMFAVLGAFMVICVVMRKLEDDDVTGLAGLNQRSPLLATTLTLAMVSLAGIPPLAGFLGKFLLLRSLVAQGASDPIYYWLLGVAIFGVVASIYYYFGIVRTIYWSRDAVDLSPITISRPAKCAAMLCIIGMLWLGLFPGVVLGWAEAAVKVLVAAKM